MKKICGLLLASSISILGLSSSSFAEDVSSYRFVFDKVELWSDTPPSFSMFLAKDGESIPAIVPSDLFSIIRSSYNEVMPTSSYYGYELIGTPYDDSTKEVSIVKKNEVGVAGEVILPEVTKLFKSCWESLSVAENPKVKDAWLLLDAPEGAGFTDDILTSISKDLIELSKVMQVELAKDGCATQRNTGYTLEEKNYSYISTLFTSNYLISRKDLAIGKGLRFLFWGGKNGGIWVEASKRHFKPILTAMLQKIHLDPIETALIYTKKISFLEWTRSIQNVDSISETWIKSIGTSCLKSVDQIFEPFSIEACEKSGFIEKHQFLMGTSTKFQTLLGKK